MERLEPVVSDLAEWSCEEVRRQIVERKDDQKWVASFDGFYLTRGHYSNNSSATIHDYHNGGIAWFTHRTKRGPGHTWEGTSGGAEGDMFDEILGKVKREGFVIKEIITDKDSSSNAIFCHHFPEGVISYCSNHCAKNMHKDLERLKKNKCEVNYCVCYSIVYSELFMAHHTAPKDYWISFVIRFFLCSNADTLNQDTLCSILSFKDGLESGLLGDQGLKSGHLVNRNIPLKSGHFCSSQ